MWSLEDEGEKMKKILAIFVLVALVIPSVMAMTADDGKNVGSIMLNNPPAKPTISGPTSGETGKSYTYTAVTTDPDGDKVFYCFDWGDGDEICTDLYNSGQEVTVSHTWNSDGDYTITVKATDENGAESEPATLKVTMPLSYDKATLSGYTGTLRVYIVEPTSRWNDHDGDPYHFGFLDYAFVGNLSIPYGETQVENITWNPSDAGYNDVNENNIMAIAAVFNPKVHQGHADPPFGNPFDAYYVDAAAAAMPGETGYNVKNENFTHTMFCEVGTATWCRYCPAMANALTSVYNSGDYPFYFVSLVADKNSIVEKRLEDYNLAGYPTAFFDGGRRVVIGGYPTESPYRGALNYCSIQDVHDLNLTIKSTWVSNELHITVSVTNNEEEDFTPPQLSVEKPQKGYIYFGDREIAKSPFGNTAIIIGKVTIQADASDESGIEKVEFMVCGELLHTATEEPYEYTYDGTFGGHTLQVIAYDRAGNTAENVINMYVINL